MTLLCLQSLRPRRYYATRNFVTQKCCFKIHERSSASFESIFRGLQKEDNKKRKRSKCQMFKYQLGNYHHEEVSSCCRRRRPRFCLSCVIHALTVGKV